MRNLHLFPQDIVAPAASGAAMRLARFLALAATLSILLKAFDKAGDLVN